MKKNNKGFTMLETLITSTLIISTLVFLYVQFNNLKRNYDDNFRFNTVQGIYNAKELVKFYKNNPGAQCDFSTNPCINPLNSDSTRMYTILNIKNSIMMSDLTSNTIDYSKILSACNQNCQRFISKIKTNTSNTRLVVIYKDNTFASVLIK